LSVDVRQWASEALGYLGHPSKVVTFGVPVGKHINKHLGASLWRDFTGNVFTACIHLCNFTTAAPRHFTEPNTVKELHWSCRRRRVKKQLRGCREDM
jgi:hypothetical protein